MSMVSSREGIDGGEEQPGQQNQDRQSMLSGEQLEEYCLQHGICPLCARTNTHERLGPFRLKLAGSNRNKNSPQSMQQQWKPITQTWVEYLKKEREQDKGNDGGKSSGAKSKKKRLFGKGKNKESLEQSVSASGSVDSIDEDAEGSANSTEADTENNQYLVYRGFCLRPGCFTLEQAKRLRGESGPYKTTVEASEKQYGYYIFQNSEEEIAKNNQDKNGEEPPSTGTYSKEKDKSKGGMSFLFGGGKIKRNKKKEGQQ